MHSEGVGVQLGGRCDVSAGEGRRMLTAVDRNPECTPSLTLDKARPRQLSLLSPDDPLGDRKVFDVPAILSEGVRIRIAVAVLTTSFDYLSPSCTLR